MFDFLILTFYWVNSIENWGVFLSYNRESKSNAGDCLLQFVLWRYQVIITIRKHSAVSTHNCTRKKIVVL